MADGAQKRTRKQKKAVCCDDCYFRRNQLCALDLPEA